MPAMSLPAQQKANTKRTGKRITFFNDQEVAMKETSQHPEGSFYSLGGPASEPGQSEAASTVTSNPEAPHMYLNSVIFSPDKGDQSRGHYQQTVPMKWAHQDPSQQQPSQPQQQRAVTWTQGVTVANWGQNFAPYLGGVSVSDSRAQTAFPKQMHEAPGLQQQQQQQQQPPSRAPDKQLLGANPAEEAYRDMAKSRGLEWEQQQQQQQQQAQAFQQTLKPGVLNAQQHGTSNPGGSSVLQPFQLAFGQPRPHMAGYYQAFQGNRTSLPNLNYSTQTKSQHQLQQQKQEQIQRQQQHQHHILQQQIQQQHHQMQQQQILQHQHVQQQLQHQQQMQQQQQIQHEQQQKMQQQQQQQQQQIQQKQIQQQMQHQQLQQQNPHVRDYYPGSQNTPPHPQPPAVVHSQETSAPAPPNIQEPVIQDITPEPQEPEEALQPPLQPLPQTQPQAQPQPRRSRRLSKEGGAPSDNPFLVSSDQADQGPQGPQNGTPEIQAAPTGVIQSTRRKRRVSQEVNLETLAQKASEMESLPSHVVKEPHRPWSPTRTIGGSPEPEGLSAKRPRDDTLMPLVIPVSVPVRRREPSSPDRDDDPLGSGWPLRPPNLQDMGLTDHKPSVIVTRRRSLRNSLSESSGQNGGTEGEKDDDAKKFKRRPRPEPLFIPPPKPGTFIVPPIYSSITPYQSHLRSPVRLVDNPLAMPPYTPPPILSPVREGSGLYFSTFLSSAAAAASGQGLPPPATPKSATRSLLRSNSCDITPPILSAIGEATPVSIEPRINIGSRYQAEVPELWQRSAVQQDLHKAELVWAPLHSLEAKPDFQDRVEGLMHLACSSVLSGGGTNQELAHHCLYECNGDIMGALALLMLQNPIFPKSHHLADYHYSGSDSWTSAERHLFNKGISAYKKDFFMVQKLVSTKTVAQCVEFYYSYKKHVKIGRNGTLVYGEAEPLETKPTEEEVDHKGSHRLESRKEEDSRKWEGSADRKRDVSPSRVTHTLQATENAGAVLVQRGQDDRRSDQPLSRVIHPPQPPPPSTTSKPRNDSNARKTASSAGAKAPAGPEGEFPCKKCGRIFLKVKSRSAHMKSHAEQEKKAAALRQKEAEERAAAQAAAEAAATLAARQQNGTREGAGDSTNNSSEGEDEDDEDWH